MKLWRYPIQLWAALVLLILPNRASAATQPEAAPVDVSQAAAVCREHPECSRLLSAAKESSAAGQVDAAREQYTQAYRITPDPMLLYNIARMLHRTGRPKEAVTYYHKYLEVGTKEESDMRSKAVAHLAQAEQESATSDEEIEPPPAQAQTEIQPQTVVAPAATASPEKTVTDLTTRKDRVIGTDRVVTTPLKQRWWIWTGIGVAVAGAAVAIGIGAAAYRPNPADAVSLRPFAQ